MQRLGGVQSKHLRLVSEGLGVRVGARGATLYLTGKTRAVQGAVRLFTQLQQQLLAQQEVAPQDVARAVAKLQQDANADLQTLFAEEVSPRKSNRRIVPKGPGQNGYIQAMKTNDVVFAVGPAGTGKTYLAMAYAICQLESKKCSRIVLTRPAIEAGERLGFLPGDLEEKISPYLRPLNDALFDLINEQQARDLLEQRVIEIAPLAFMRGRTLSDAFVILDEAQNTTREQMKMFLTRLGFGSKMVITGDATQVDLPVSSQSGLAHATALLQEVQGIAVCRLTAEDVVRHPLVNRIVDAYESSEGSDEQQGP